MLERVGNLLPHDISRIWGGTFHSVANRLLRRHANALGFSSDFTILDRDDAADLAVAALRATGGDPKDKTLPKGAVLLDIFGLAANTEKSIASVVDSHYPFFNPILDKLEAIHRIFRDRKKTDNVMDYDDLLVYALRLLQDHEDVRKFYQEQFQHVLVDEYQDTNKIQSDFIDTLAAYHHQVMAVGDDAQSIYSWRGANFENVLTFPQRFPGTREVRIETNYRSTPEILALANYAIAANTKQFPKNLHAVRPAEKYSKPALICLQDANQQAQFICQRIEELSEEGIELNEIAVLYRAHFHSMELQMEMTRRQMPFELLSGLRFFEQAHVKDVAAFLKFALNPKDELAFKRIAGLMPGVGEKTADKIWHEAHRRRGVRHARAAGQGRGRLEAVGRDARADLRARTARPRLGANPGRDRRDLRGLHEDEVPEFPVAAGGPGAAARLRAEFREDRGFPRAARAHDQRRWRAAHATAIGAARPALRAAEHDPPGQGPRVESGLRHHALRRAVPRRALHADARGRGGGAAAVLRRGHARVRRALPHLSADARHGLVRRPLAGAVALRQRFSARAWSTNGRSRPPRRRGARPGLARHSSM